MTTDAVTLTMEPPLAEWLTFAADFADEWVHEVPAKALAVARAIPGTVGER